MKTLLTGQCGFISSTNESKKKKKNGKIVTISRDAHFSSYKNNGQNLSV